MKKLFLPCIAAATAASIAFAAPADDVKAAAKKLADASNYSWSTTPQNAGGAGGAGGGGGGRGGFGGGGPSSGVTEKGGYTITTRQGQNGPTQTVRKGETSVSQNQQGEWMTTQELVAQFGQGRGGGQGGQARGQGGQGGQGGGRRGAGGGAGGGRGAGGGFGLGGGMNPAEELAALVDSAKDLKSADGAIMGSLTDEAVTQRLGRGGFGGRGGGGGGGGQAATPPKNVSGTLKVWLKDGAVAKYEYRVKGTVQGRNGEQERDTTTTVEIKDIGSTKVEVPAGAKAKLGA